MQACGLLHSILVTVPCNLTGWVESNSAVKAWCAHADVPHNKRPAATTRPASFTLICSSFLLRACSPSAVPTIWATCFALTTQKFNKGRTKPNLSPKGDRSGYKFRSVQGRGQAFFGETGWNGTSRCWGLCGQTSLGEMGEILLSDTPRS